MSINQQRLDEFNAKMNNWVSRQGFFFQLVRGSGSGWVNYFVSLGGKILFLLLACLLLGWGALFFRVGGKAFQAQVNESMGSFFGATETGVSNFRRKQGELTIWNVNMTGGKESFFETFSGREARFQMGMLDGILGNPWKGKRVSLSGLDLILRTGAEEKKDASAMYASLFKKAPNFQVEGINVGTVNISWGYSESTRGSIQGSQMILTRKGEGWKVVIRGGKLFQNWLNGIEIEELVFDLQPSGMKIVKGAFFKGEGKMSLTGKILGNGGRPIFDLKGKVESLELTDFLSPIYRNFFEATVSGDLVVGGSVYSQKGLEIALKASLKSGDSVVLKDQIPIMKTLGGFQHSYIYWEFRLKEGSFQMKTEGGDLSVTDVSLTNEKVSRLEGSFTVKPQTFEEIMVAQKDLWKKEGEEDDLTTDKPKDDLDTRLFKDDKESSNGDEPSFKFTDDQPSEEGNARKKPLTPLEKEIDLAERVHEKSLSSVTEFSEKFIQERARLKKEGKMKLKGFLRFGVKKDVFGSHQALNERFPVDSESPFRWLDVAIDDLLEDASAKEGEELSNLRYQKK